MKRSIPVSLILLIAFSSNAEAELTPSDPLFDQQWGLYNSKSGIDIDAKKAWAIERGNKNIAIVIIDSGVDYNHPDLVNNMWVNPGEIPNNGIDDDGNGYIDDVHGVNVITGSGDPMDDHGHGTFLAGVVGAEGNNGIGIAGVMHKVSLIACKFLRENGSGSSEGAKKCLDYVADLATRDIGVTIVATNNAWGGSKNEAIKAAIEKHRDLGILFMTISGGDSIDLDGLPETEKIYPASYGVDNIIVASYMDPFGMLTSFSSYGPNTVHIASPGLEIVSTLPNGKYDTWSGSAAVGLASGIVGLMKSQNPSLTYLEIKKRLLESAENLATPEEQAKVSSGGFVNAYRCLVE